ncbi:MAG TPA: hypothetical protein VGH28_07395 [Polyangiaceae bacterium]|jgi:hypothetical protein
MNIQPPAARARKTAMVLSAIAVAFAIAFGFAIRSWFAMVHGEVVSTLDGDGFAALYLVGALLLLLIAVLLRIFAGICELVWLERTWSNLPAEHRRVGPIENVTPVHIFGIAFIPVVAWFWKLALISAVANSLELVRKDLPFRAAVPRRLGVTACILGWLPPLNLYLAPFLWEMFARRIDVVCLELAALDQGLKN